MVPVSSPAPVFAPHNRKEWRQSWKEQKLLRKQDKLQRKLDKKQFKFEKKAEHIQEKAMKYGTVRLVQESLIPANPVAGSEAIQTWR